MDSFRGFNFSMLSLSHLHKWKSCGSNWGETALWAFVMFTVSSVQKISPVYQPLCWHGFLFHCIKFGSNVTAPDYPIWHSNLSCLWGSLCPLEYFIFLHSAPHQLFVCDSPSHVASFIKTRHGFCFIYFKVPTTKNNARYLADIKCVFLKWTNFICPAHLACY